MVEKSICHPSKSPWSSPLHLIRKTSKEWRTCGDYRRLKAATVPDRYSIPNLEDFIHNLHGKMIFSTIELLCACHEIPVAKEDIEKTAINSLFLFRLSEFSVMPFGLRNAVGTCLDDILIASS